MSIESGVNAESNAADRLASRRRSRQLVERGETSRGDSRPILGRDAAAAMPELRSFDDPDVMGSQGLCEGLISPGAGDDVRMGPHFVRVRNAPDLVKADLHPADGYERDMSRPDERLAQARRAAGYSTATEAAERLGVPKETYVQHERGIRGFGRRAEQYAKAFGVDAAWLMFGEGSGPDSSTLTGAPQRRVAESHGRQGFRPAKLTKVTRFVPVLGEVRAGVWTDVPHDQVEPEEMLPIHLPGFEAAQLYALRVEGKSMDLAYPEGSRIIVCPAAEIGIRQGDHVVVRRWRNGLMETTLKEIVQDRDGVLLWPRSTDPAFQSPIRLSKAPDSDDGTEIIGVVVASYNLRPQQSRPLIQL